MMLAINIVRASCGSEKEQSGCVLSGMDADTWASIGGRGCSGLLGADKLCELTLLCSQLPNYVLSKNNCRRQQNIMAYPILFSQSLLQLGFLDVGVT